MRFPALRTSLTVLAVALGALVAAPLAAPPPQPAQAEGRAAELQRLLDCRKITDGAQRLACFDAASAAFDQAEAKGDIVVVNREQARKVRRQAFGFTLPSMSLFERGEKPEEINTVQAKVAAVRQNGAGKWVIRLEDGATWVQVDNNEINPDPAPGEVAEIRRASLGSYMMILPHHRSFRAHREQ
jgi:hypothetical protein